MSLNKLREEIDFIDKELVKLFEKRLNVVEKIGEYKKKNLLPILDKQREQEVLNKNLRNVGEEKYFSYIKDFLISNAEISKKLQRDNKDYDK